MTTTNVTPVYCGTCGQPLTDGACTNTNCMTPEKYAAIVAKLIKPSGKFTVRLASAGNPDFGQDPRRSMPGVPKLNIRVASLRDASALCRAYIAHHDLGGGNWLGGEVTVDRKIVAYISYNGRAWDPRINPMTEIPLEPA